MLYVDFLDNIFRIVWLSEFSIKKSTQYCFMNALVQSLLAVLVFFFFKEDFVPFLGLVPFLLSTPPTYLCEIMCKCVCGVCVKNIEGVHIVLGFQKSRDYFVNTSFSFLTFYRKFYSDSHDSLESREVIQPAWNFQSVQERNLCHIRSQMLCVSDSKADIWFPYLQVSLPISCQIFLVALFRIKFCEGGLGRTPPMCLESLPCIIPYFIIALNY